MTRTMTDAFSCIHFGQCNLALLLLFIPSSLLGEGEHSNTKINNKKISQAFAVMLATFLPANGAS